MSDIERIIIEAEVQRNEDAADAVEHHEPGGLRIFGMNYVTLFIASINLVIVGTVFVLLIQTDGEIALLGCRIVATIGVLFMIISICRMLQIYNCIKNQTFNSETPMPIIMGFFVFFMTLISLYGYFSKISKLIIFWDFDFVLHYSSQILELTMDIIYIPTICIFLIIQLLFFLIVAPVNGIGDSDAWLFCTTLFINSLQKWLFESTVVHMELCEEFNKNGSLCSKYMHYYTSYENLTREDEEHYFSIKEIEPFTYTITMELFIACIGLILFYKQHKHEHINLPQIEEDVKPNSLLVKYFFLPIVFFIIIVFPLLMIIAVPIINVTTEEWLRDSRIIIRFFTHLANFSLLYYVKNLFNVPCKFKLGSEADIIIMWIAAIVNVLKAMSKFVIHSTLLCQYMTTYQAIWFSIDQIGKTLETFSFYFLILIVERLLLIAEQLNNNENTKRYINGFTLAFLPLYFCASLIGFAAYYNLNTLHFFPAEVKSAFGVNLIVFLQSIYPTTMLFTMTVCLSIASIIEKLYQKGYYRLRILQQI